jgi:hypothetical protein
MIKIIFSEDGTTSNGKILEQFHLKQVLVKITYANQRNG